MLAYKNYIFDFYGTLVHIETDEESLDFWRTIAELYSSLGATYEASELRKAYIRLVADEEANLAQPSQLDYVEIDILQVFKRLYTECPNRDKLSWKLDLETASRLIAAAFRIESRKELRAYDATVQLLDYLKSQGDKIFLLSNAQKAFTLQELKQTGLYDYFDKIYISSDYGMKKPRPQFWEMVLTENKLNLSESVMIGNDFTTDIAIADSLGMDSIFINSFNYNEKELKEKNTSKVPVVEDIGGVMEVVTCMR
ncbi:HAD family hydrolase [Streptococcus loxodontisalivarius]|uniref:Hydrolase of the HAD superfamily n=1 Tax=Streptococcus loxodontisalivarius TaxID=1349415 RepID=A0ABS2PSU7_9STRE|nr:HAD family hydrolase [Streptococcus loxodontisalivarius]MBM7643001.1 putative hydrolase of the HAD superfamily [Streptococcus loxodontisalivarius]